VIRYTEDGEALATWRPGLDGEASGEADLSVSLLSRPSARISDLEIALYAAGGGACARQTLPPFTNPPQSFPLPDWEVALERPVEEPVYLLQVIELNLSDAAAFSQNGVMVIEVSDAFTGPVLFFRLEEDAARAESWLAARWVHFDPAGRGVLVGRQAELRDVDDSTSEVRLYGFDGQLLRADAAPEGHHLMAPLDPSFSSFVTVGRVEDDSYEDCVADATVIYGDSFDAFTPGGEDIDRLWLTQDDHPHRHCEYVNDWRIPYANTVSRCGEYTDPAGGDPAPLICGATAEHPSSYVLTTRAGGGRSWVLSNPMNLVAYAEWPDHTTALSYDFDGEIGAMLDNTASGESLVRLPHSLDRAASGHYALYNRNGDSFCATTLLATIDLEAGGVEIIDIHPWPTGALYPQPVPESGCGSSAARGGSFFALADTDDHAARAGVTEVTDLLVMHSTDAPFHTDLLDTAGGAFSVVARLQATDLEPFTGELLLPYTFAHQGRPHALRGEGGPGD